MTPSGHIVRLRSLPLPDLDSNLEVLRFHEPVVFRMPVVALKRFVKSEVEVSNNKRDQFANFKHRDMAADAYSRAETKLS